MDPYLRRLALILLPLAAYPQTSPDPLKTGSIAIQGWVRSRLENWDAFSGTENGHYTYSGNFLRLTVSQSFQRWDWAVELNVPFLLGLPSDAVLAAPQGALGQGATYFQNNHNHRNAAMLFPRQAFVRWKAGDQSVRLGRFDFIDGSEATPRNATLAVLKRDRINQRILGPFGFTHVWRAFDGLHYAANSGNVSYAVVGALPTRGVFQVDGWGPLRTAVGYASATGQLPGKTHYGEWRVLGMYYHDWRNVQAADNRPAAVRTADRSNIRVANFGGHYLHAVETPGGTFDFLAWGMLQTGRWNRLDHRAGAVALEAGWQPKILPRLKPWLQAGVYHGSGDGNPDDGVHHTFFQILPTARPYARFPFFNLMNNQDSFVSLIVRPHKAVTARADLRSIRLARSQDLWYQGGGAFQPWTFGFAARPSLGARSLATLYDASVDWTIDRHTAFTFYYGCASGKSVLAAIYPGGKNGHFGFVEANYRF